MMRHSGLSVAQRDSIAVTLWHIDQAPATSVIAQSASLPRNESAPSAYDVVEDTGLSALRVTQVATRLEELIQDEANDSLTPEQLFLIAVDDALESRRVGRVDKLIRQTALPISVQPSLGISVQPSLGLTTARDAG